MLGLLRVGEMDAGGIVTRNDVFMALGVMTSMLEQREDEVWDQRRGMIQESHRYLLAERC